MGSHDVVKIKRVLTKFGVVRCSPGIQNLIKDREEKDWSPLNSKTRLQGILENLGPFVR